MEIQVKHLLNRAAFGTSPAYWKVQSGDLDQWVDRLFRDSAGHQPLEVISLEDLGLSDIRTMDKAAIKAKFKSMREKIKDLNLQWISAMHTGKTALREKMTLFWHDHFACRTLNPLFAQNLNNTLRAHALGNFGELLHAVSKEPAMLQFLNNQQNRKSSPNENFARELMELFTLGRGKYTESDIKEAARAFTGWGFNLQARYVFRQRVHDFGTKTFRGKSGKLRGEDIIDAILEDAQTAQFITAKVCDYFTGGNLPSAETMNELAGKFYQSQYDISTLLQDIFTSSWFYDPEVMGNKVKAPVDLIVGLMHQLDSTFQQPEAALFVQKALGQVLFFPPNVGGWPSGQAWIDSSSLTFRLSMAPLVLGGQENDFQVKKDPEEGNRNRRDLRFALAWDQLTARLGWTSNDIAALEEYLLPASTSKDNRQRIMKYAQQGKDDYEFFRHAVIGFASLPEYQMC